MLQGRQESGPKELEMGAPAAVRGTSDNPATAQPAAATSTSPPSAKQDTFGKTLKLLLIRSGVDISKYIDERSVTQWASVPAGFLFREKAPGDIGRIASLLASSPDFGQVTLQLDRLAKGPDGRRHFGDFAFREVGRPDSLHVILYNNPKQPSIIHLDTHSVAVAKDSRTGEVIYSDDFADLAAHIHHDLRHK